MFMSTSPESFSMMPFVLEEVATSVFDSSIVAAMATVDAGLSAIVWGIEICFTAVGHCSPGVSVAGGLSATGVDRGLLELL